MKNKSNRLAVKMLIAMIAGIAAGLVFMAIRESLGATSAAWTTINNLLFQDITAAGAESAIGLFYIGGQLFVRSLQLVIVPMVFTSIVLAIATISDASALGRVSLKTLGWFLCTSVIALVLAGTVDNALLEPAPVAMISGYGESAINYSLRIWVKSENYWDVYFLVNQRVKQIFDEQGVYMTYPHLNIHVKQ